jgi:hypothetical protein
MNFVRLILIEQYCAMTVKNIPVATVSIFPIVEEELEDEEEEELEEEPCELLDGCPCAKLARLLNWTGVFCRNCNEEHEDTGCFNFCANCYTCLNCMYDDRDEGCCDCGTILDQVPHSAQKSRCDVCNKKAVMPNGECYYCLY